jgi:hypothetical protein
MTGAPVVSVLMSVHNGRPFLREAIESILAQTFTDLEFLIVNDGSTDGTEEIISSYRDPRIRLIRHASRRGLTRSLNQGLRSAAGRYIARQDSDDVSEPDRLARQVAYMEANPDIGLLGTWYREIDENGSVLAEQRLPCADTDLRWALLFYCPFIHSAAMFRSEVRAAAGLYDEAYVYAQDHDYWLRIAKRFALANLDEILVNYRIHARSMTSTYGPRTREEIRVPAAAVADLLGWRETEEGPQGERFERLFAFVYGPLDDLDPRTIGRLATETRELHRAFSRANHLSRREEKRHLREVAVRISRRCITSAHHRLARGDDVGARDLFRQALAWHWPILVRSRSSMHLIRSLRAGLRARSRSHVARGG